MKKSLFLFLTFLSSVVAKELTEDQLIWQSICKDTDSECNWYNNGFYTNEEIANNKFDFNEQIKLLDIKKIKFDKYNKFNKLSNNDAVKLKDVVNYMLNHKKEIIYTLGVAVWSALVYKIVLYCIENNIKIEDLLNINFNF